MMKIAIVGATGPTGIHLVTELRKAVATVRVIARSMHKLAQLFPDAAVEKWEADIRDAGALRFIAIVLEQHVQWNTCNAGFSDRTISMSATGSPRARNKFTATTLSRSSKSS